MRQPALRWKCLGPVHPFKTMKMVHFMHVYSCGNRNGAGGLSSDQLSHRWAAWLFRTSKHIIIITEGCILQMGHPPFPSPLPQIALTCFFFVLVWNRKTNANQLSWPINHPPSPDLLANLSLLNSACRPISESVSSYPRSSNPSVMAISKCAANRPNLMVAATFSGSWLRECRRNCDKPSTPTPPSTLVLKIPCSPSSCQVIGPLYWILDLKNTIYLHCLLSWKPALCGFNFWGETSSAICYRWQLWREPIPFLFLCLLWSSFLHKKSLSCLSGGRV